MKTTLKLFTLLAIVTALAFGQTAVTQTTISAAMTNSQNTITLASATGVTAGTAGQTITGAYLDREFVLIGSLVTGTTYNVRRGQQGTRPHAHISGAIVWIGPIANGPFNPITPEQTESSGTCTATAEAYLPRIYIVSGHKYDCLGVAPNGQWAQTSSPGVPILGSTVASPAGVMTSTGTIYIVSGTNAVTGLLVPGGWGSGMALTLLPTGAFTTTTATNIAIASTAVVGKALIMTWNATTSKWYPSY